MREMIWVGPDGRRYQVNLVKEPGEDRWRSIVFRGDGWTGATRIAAALCLLDLLGEDLERALGRARE